MHACIFKAFWTIFFVCLIKWIAGEGLFRLGGVPDLPEQNLSCWKVSLICQSRIDQSCRQTFLAWSILLWQIRQAFHAWSILLRQIRQPTSLTNLVAAWLIRRLPDPNQAGAWLIRTPVCEKFILKNSHPWFQSYPIFTIPDLPLSVVPMCTDILGVLWDLPCAN